MDDRLLAHEFDPNHKLPHGYYRCSACGAEFYDLNQPLHFKTCPHPTVERCVYRYGPKEEDPTPEMQKWIEGTPTRLELLIDDKR